MRQERQENQKDISKYKSQLQQDALARADAVKVDRTLAQMKKEDLDAEKQTVRKQRHLVRTTELEQQVAEIAEAINDVRMIEQACLERFQHSQEERAVLIDRVGVKPLRSPTRAVVTPEPID